jgi:hypothetical protein
MERGYVHMWRKTLDSQIFSNPGLLKVWVWCLLKANHKECWMPYSTGRGDSELLVKSGQFIFGRFSASKELKMKPSVVYDRISKLKKLKNIVMESNNHCSVISICNWEIYQSKATGKATGKATAKQQPSNTNNNVNNIKDINILSEMNPSDATNVPEKIEKPKQQYSDDFESFWHEYPNKISKVKCFEKWKRLNPSTELLQKMLLAIENQKKWRDSANGEFRPEWKHAMTWLNGGCWDDEAFIPEQEKLVSVEEVLRKKREANGTER